MQDHAPSHHDRGYETAPFLFQELPKSGSPKSDFTVPKSYGIETLLEKMLLPHGGFVRQEDS